MYTVYILRSIINQRRYTGYTSNLEKRLQEHNSGKTKSLQRVRPLEIIYTEEYISRLEAIRRERFFKSGQGRVYLKSIGK